jgi:hypothetical protein
VGFHQLEQPLKGKFRKRFTQFPAEHWLCGVVISSLSDIFTF